MCRWVNKRLFWGEFQPSSQTDLSTEDNLIVETLRANVDHWTRMGKDVGDVIHPMIAEWKREQM
jgi:hypothetical protein